MFKIFLLFLPACTSFHTVSASAPTNEVYVEARTGFGPLVFREWLLYCKEAPSEDIDGFTCFRVVNINETRMLNPEGRDAPESFYRRWPESISKKAETKATPTSANSVVDADAVTAKVYEALGLSVDRSSDAWQKDVETVRFYLGQGLKPADLVAVAKVGAAKGTKTNGIEAVIQAGLK